ncbi:hypothetical protein BDV38DRAFT_277928 [Aspergillus pseudotamarii]|uniref:Nucleoside phosphorylase domain-containing protein n=1 Tax=Aspergillus pseudotamarii TaxID=132259 RepID=A0A5N6T7P3_ASPPS|nr:uncharacterized protein BDV38DRAFT_277928 [Aspergillus pseudotamarii]KAE8142398.1 hypothetical protein BDV38DRAFT_277928 [Aspergillus pseudotamarii]
MTAQADTKSKRLNEYTVGWICTLLKEQTAATTMLDQRHPGLPQPSNDHNTYTLGSIGKHNVMVRTFPSIKVGLMVGIGGGIPPKVRLGDVVVSTPVGEFPGVVQWDMGKTKDGSFERTGALNNPPTSLLTALTKLETEHDLYGTKIPETLDGLKLKWPRLSPKYLKCDSFEDTLNTHEFHQSGSRWQVISRLLGMILTFVTYLLGWRVFTPRHSGPEQVTSNAMNTGHEGGQNKPGDVRVHYGLIASGNQAIKDATFRDKLDRQFGGHVLCVETEAAGLMNDFPCIVIRGIYNYADSHENQEWQEYAATVAAAFAKELLEYVKPSDVEEGRSVKDLLGQIHDTVSRNRIDLKVMRSKLDKKEDQDVLNWLTPIDYGPQQSDIFRRRQPGTGKWLLRSVEFQKWLNTSRQTLFCSGIPGAGKTVLTSIVVHNLINVFSRDPTVGIAYIYCNFQRKDEQNIDHLFASLLKQLTESCSPLPESVKVLFNHNKAQRTRPPLEDILSALHSIVAKYSRVFIIVDALDECQTSEGCRMKLLSEISGLQAKNGANIFITSRIDDGIGKKFAKAIYLKVYARDDDIEMYLDERMRLQHSDIFDDTIKSTIKRDVIKATDGMFLLAELHMDSLLSLPTRGHIKHALQTLTKGIEKLDKIYDQAMKRIEDHGKECRDLVKQILAWTFYARRPLLTLELQHALAVRPHTAELDEDYLPSINLLQSLCVGLVTIDEENGTIRLAHYTTQDYFQRTQQRWFSGGESEITKSCVIYLSFSAFQGGPCDTDEEFEKRLQSCPFYNYAAQYWGHHARDASTLCPEVIEFLSCGMKVEASAQALMAPNSAQPYIEHHYQKFPRKVTGLHLAAYFGVEEAVKTLLKKRAEPDAIDSHGRTPLSYAAQNGHSTISKLLLEKDIAADSLANNELLPLLHAMGYGHTAIMEQPLATGRAEPDFKNSRGRIVSSAVWERYGTTVEQLLETCRVGRVSNVSTRRIPVSLAVWNGYEMVVRLRLEIGTDMETRYTLYGGIRLYLAAENGHEVVVKPLLSMKKLKANVKDSFGRISLFYATKFGHGVGITFILSNSVISPNQVDYDGSTLLSSAVRNSHAEQVKILLATEIVACDSRNCFGRTVFWWARRSGHKDIEKMLFEYAKKRGILLSGGHEMTQVKV